MLGYQPARFLLSRDEPEDHWRALCWWPRCSGELAEVVTTEEGLPPTGLTVWALARVPAAWVEDQQGVWGEPKRPPRRPFVSGWDGRRAVGGGFERNVVGPRDPQGRSLTKLLKTFLGLGPDPVVRCPRCGEPSILCAEHFRAAYQARLKERGT